MTGRRSNPAEIRSLTGLRGVAACFVVLYHYVESDTSHGMVHRLINHGYLAVDLFFVLSGFVMALTYASGFTDNFSWRGYFGFLGKRLARVYPLFVTITVAVIVLAATRLVDLPIPSALATVSNLLMIQAWGLADSIVGPTWSISTEFAAYLVFPALVVLALQGRRVRAAAILCCAIGLLALVATRSAAELHQIYHQVPERSGMLDAYGAGTLFPLLRCLAGFTLGLLAFRVAREMSQRHQPVIPRHTTEVIAALVLILLAVPGSDIALVLIFPLLVLALAAGQSATAKLLGGPVIYFLGEISYSIYLVHRPLEALIRPRLISVLNLIHAPHAYTGSGALALLFTVPVAAATFYGIEKPARRWARGLMNARSRPIQSEPAAP